MLFYGSVPEEKYSARMPIPQNIRPSPHPQKFYRYFLHSNRFETREMILRRTILFRAVLIHNVTLLSEKFGKKNAVAYPPMWKTFFWNQIQNHNRKESSFGQNTDTANVEMNPFSHEA